MALRTAASRLGSLLVQDGAASQIRGVATLKVPDLPYDFGALEPFVSGKARGDRCAAGLRLHALTRNQHARPQRDLTPSSGAACAVRRSWSCTSPSTTPPTSTTTTLPSPNTPRSVGRSAHEQGEGTESILPTGDAPRCAIHMHIHGAMVRWAAPAGQYASVTPWTSDGHPMGISGGESTPISAMRSTAASNFTSTTFIAPSNLLEQKTGHTNCYLSLTTGREQGRRCQDDSAAGCHQVQRWR